MTPVSRSIIWQCTFAQRDDLLIHANGPLGLEDGRDPVMADFLSQANLARVPHEVERPGYDRRAVDIGIVHFGPGAFHRVHQAWFVEKLLANDPRWGICAVSLRSPDVRDALVPQDGLYTLAALDGTTSYQVIGALKQTLVAREDPETVLEQLCAPRTRVVTITVTEKGYCLGA